MASVWNCSGKEKRCAGPNKARLRIGDLLKPKWLRRNHKKETQGTTGRVELTIPFLLVLR